MGLFMSCSMTCLFPLIAFLSFLYKRKTLPDTWTNRYNYLIIALIVENVDSSLIVLSAIFNFILPIQTISKNHSSFKMSKFLVVKIIHSVEEGREKDMELK